LKIQSWQVKKTLNYDYKSGTQVYIHGGNWFAYTGSYVDFDWITVNSTAVPLPGGLLLLGSGIMRLWISRKKL